MRLRVLVSALALLTAAARAEAQESVSAEPESEAELEAVDEIEGVEITAQPPVVTFERRGPVSPDPFTVFADHCFHSNRLKGRSARPVDDPTWRPLDGATRQRLTIANPTAVAYGRFDSGLPLVLRIEERSRRGGLVEHRCSLTIAGHSDPPALVGRMSKLFNGGGTQKHVGHRDAPGYRPLPGWSQWLWSAIPARGSTNWEVWRNPDKHARRPGGSFILVNASNPGGFYQRMTYVAGELAYQQSATTPVSILTLVHTFKR